MYKYDNFYKCSWYRYQVYKARKQLAVIDWNYHVNRGTSMNEHSEAQYTRKYNQRTKEWNTRVVKVPKDFGYIPIMMAKIFKRRFEDRNPTCVLTVTSRCQKMTRQGLLQLLLRFHPCPRRSFTSGTNQGFRNAKLIYFQQNNQPNKQHLDFRKGT